MQGLDQSRWQALMTRIGARDAGGQVFKDLESAYGERHRYYHNHTHLRGCFKLFDAVRGHFQRPDEGELALWFHDAIYRTRSTLNEAESAAWARRFLEEESINQASAERVAQMILSTRHDQPAPTPDAALVCDIDLAVLGVPPDVYDDFEHRVRREYWWVPEPTFVAKRQAILERFLSADSIYQTDLLRELLEPAARANLTRWCGILGRRRSAG